MDFLIGTSIAFLFCYVLHRYWSKDSGVIRGGKFISPEEDNVMTIKDREMLELMGVGISTKDATKRFLFGTEISSSSSKDQI